MRIGDKTDLAQALGLCRRHDLRNFFGLRGALGTQVQFGLRIPDGGIGDARVQLNRIEYFRIPVYLALSIDCQVAFSGLVSFDCVRGDIALQSGVVNPYRLLLYLMIQLKDDRHQRIHGERLAIIEIRFEHCARYRDPCRFIQPRIPG